MSRILIWAGIALMVMTGIATMASVATGTAQWLGLVAAHAVLPPQSLVVGGLFLGVPLMALGWALIWFGRWAREHR